MATDANKTVEDMLQDEALEPIIDMNALEAPGIEIDGDDTAEVLNGTDDDDTINGNGGNDTINGLGGIDELSGGDDDDTISGNKGDDFMFGDAGDDRLIWNNGDGSDLMDGGAGEDEVQVNFFTDLENLNVINDDVAEIFENGENVRFARVELNGQTEAGLFELDIRNTEGIEVNFGGGEDTARLDDLVTSDFDITLDGGDDEVGQTPDPAAGDTIDVSAVSQGVYVNLDIGQPGGEAGEITTVEFFDTQNIATKTFAAEISDFENAIGTEQADVLGGNEEANILSGLGGNDRIFGRGGNDVIVGNKGDDQMFGDAGDDLLVWNNGDGSDLIVGGEGQDKVQVNFFTDLVDNDLQNDDVAEVSVNGDTVQFARVELNGQTERGLFALDIQEIEELEINFGGGNDTLRLLAVVDPAVAAFANGGDDDNGEFGDAATGDTLDFSQLEIPEPDPLLEEVFPLTNEVNIDDNDLLVDFENVIGSDAIDEITGNDEANFLSGQGGDDIIEGRGGNDLIVGNKGDDQMFGEEGDDLLVWNNGDGSDLMVGGEGEDKVQVNFFTDLVDNDLDNDDVAEIFDDGDGTVTFARVELNGQTERGLFALDIQETEEIEVNFGDGNDTARMNDLITTDFGVTLEGGDDDTGDQPDPAAGDTLDLSLVSEGVYVALDALKNGSEEGAVSNVGNFGGGPRTFFVQANDFENAIGTEEGDVLDGNGQANVFSGLGGEDTLFGRGGNDLLVGNKGDDEVFGEEGDDLLVWNNGDGSDLMHGGTGLDRLQVNFNTDLVNDDLQNDDVADIEATPDGFEFSRIAVNGQSVNGLFDLDSREIEELEVNFGGGDDVGDFDDPAVSGLKMFIDGGDGEDEIRTGSADDEITGGAGDDTLAGGAGSDKFIYADGFGDDTIEDFGVTTGDVIDLSGVSGVASIDDLEIVDIKIAEADTASVIRIKDGESITLFGVAAADLSAANFVFRPQQPDPQPNGDYLGYEGVDIYTGGDAGEFYNGFAGDDILGGAGGDDTMVGGSGNDLLDGGEGDDTMRGNNDDDVMTGGTGDDAMNGGAGDDELDGGDGNDVMRGNSGDDAMTGGAGDDELYGGGGADVMNGGDGNDLMLGVTGDDLMFGGAGEDNMFGRADNDTMDGGDGDDRLTGNQGDDTLIGGAGRDLLLGGGGNDILTGGEGPDVFIFQNERGQDTITDFEIGADLINLARRDFGDRGVEFTDLELIQQGDDTLVRERGLEITLEGINAADLSADDFIF